jgi:hypothetical protein
MYMWTEWMDMNIWRVETESENKANKTCHASYGDIDVWLPFKSRPHDSWMMSTLIDGSVPIWQGWQMLCVL